jgi:hypothetical protein
MATKVPGNALAGTQLDERAMPAALAKALQAKAREKGAATRDAPAAGDLADMRAGPASGDSLIDDDGPMEDDRALDPGAPDMPNGSFASGEDKQDERQLPPEVNGKVAEINQYPGYSADADDNSTGIWKKTPDQASGTLPEGSFQRAGRFPDTPPWRQV